jgi:hypothetical protein
MYDFVDSSNQSCTLHSGPTLIQTPPYFRCFHQNNLVKMYFNPFSKKRLILITINITHQGLIAMCLGSKGVILYYVNYQWILIHIEGCIVCNHCLFDFKMLMCNQKRCHISLFEKQLHLWLLFYIAIVYTTLHSHILTPVYIDTYLPLMYYGLNKYKIQVSN